MVRIPRRASSSEITDWYVPQGDEECFELFKDIVNPVVKGWHGFDPATQFHK